MAILALPLMDGMGMEALAQPLFELEQIDREIEAARVDLNSMRRSLGHNPELDAGLARLHDLKSRERDTQVEQRRMEAELSEVEGKIKRAHGRMYSGVIVDSRELASLERELEGYQERKSTLEESLIGTMEAAESIAKEIAEQERTVGDLQSAWQTDEPALEERVKDLSALTSELEAKREALLARVEPRSLDLYRRLRSQSGHAVSQVRDGVCEWCRVVVPPKDVQHARSGALVTCTNCARILYVPG